MEELICVLKFSSEDDGRKILPEIVLLFLRLNKQKETKNIERKMNMFNSFSNLDIRTKNF